MKFTCTNPNCVELGQSMELDPVQVLPKDFDFKQYSKTNTPFFVTYPPILCGYCGVLAYPGEVPDDLA